MTWSYSDPAISPNDAVRFEIQDTVATSPLLQDEEILYSLAQEAGTEPTTGYTQANILSAAAHCCEALVRRFSMQADSQVGQLRLTYSKQADGFAKRAAELRARAQGMQGPYVGGMSASEKRAILQDFDRVQPAISRDQFNNPWTGQAGNAFLDLEDLGPHVGS